MRWSLRAWQAVALCTCTSASQDNTLATIMSPQGLLFQTWRWPKYGFIVLLCYNALPLIPCMIELDQTVMDSESAQGWITFENFRFFGH